VRNVSLQVNMLYPYTRYNHIYYTVCSSYLLTDTNFMLHSLYYHNMLIQHSLFQIFSIYKLYLFILMFFRIQEEKKFMTRNTFLFI
ncbi:expressed protein, partial [Phakopsora pachyrhizi]